MEARHFTELAVCAVRYALGRMTYVSRSVPEAIESNFNMMTSNGLKIIVRDIDERKKFEGCIGMKCDDENWMRLKEKCANEIARRSTK